MADHWTGGEIQRTTNGSMGGIGTPIRIQQNSVFKVKPVAVKKTGEQYAWDENEAPSGIINKAADWLVSHHVWLDTPASAH